MNECSRLRIGGALLLALTAWLVPIGAAGAAEQYSARRTTGF